MKKKKKTLLTRINKLFKFFYKNVENYFNPIWLRGKKSQNEPTRAVRRMNNVISKYYKRPELLLNDPENIEKIQFKTDDSLLITGVKYTPNKESKKWVITMHWFAGHKYWALYHAKAFVEMGYNILAIDFRGHGESDSDSITMGAREYKDCLGALKWLKENEEYEDLAIMGTSMGAYVTNFVCVNNYEMIKKEYKVKFGVADCPYGSIENLLIHTRNQHLKIIPKIRSKRSVRKVIERHNVIEEENGTNLNDANIFKLLENGQKPAYPILFMHSKDDKVTPPLDTMQLLIDRKKYIENDGLIMLNYSMHTQGTRIHFKEYQNQIAKYIAQMNDDWEGYNKLVKKWNIQIIDRKDKKSEKLK